MSAGEHDHRHGHAPEHPRERAVEPEDPMELDAAAAPGDPTFMLACIIEEFARIGTSREEILGLFADPFFQATHGLAGLLGPDEVRRRVDAILARCGIHQVRTITLIGPEPGGG